MYRSKPKTEAGATTWGYTLIALGLILASMSFASGLPFVGSTIENLVGFVSLSSLLWIGLASMAMGFFVLVGDEDG